MPRPKVYDDELRQRLLDQAALAIAQTGPGGLALRPVAQAVGTSTTAIYSIFGGRSELIAAVGRAARDGFVAAQGAVPITEDPYTDLMNLGRAYRRWAIANPVLYQVLMSPTDPTLSQEGPMPQSQAALPLRSAVVRLIESGVYPPIIPEAIVGPIWSSVHGFVILELSGLLAPANEEQRARMYEGHLEAIRRGWRIG